MGSKTHRGVCPDMACERTAIEKARQKSERKAIGIVAEELGVPFNTVKSWVVRDKLGADAPKKQNNAIFETCAISDLQNLIDNGKKFATIYSDPPWKYGNQATRAATDNHYETMTPKEIAELPIAQLSEDNAHLHLWTTNAFLFDAKTILEAWGFEYKSCFIWVKPQMGIGNYWRVSHEFLLLGVKGSLTFANHAFKSWMEIDRTKHSRKPEEIAEIIEKVSPGPYLELFGRRTREKWTVWGDQVERDLFNKDAFERNL